MFFLLVQLIFVYFFFHGNDCAYCYPQATNNQISSLPEDMVNCSKLSKLDVEVLL